MQLFTTPWLQERRMAPLSSYAAPAYGRRYGRHVAVPAPKPHAPGPYAQEPAWPLPRLRRIDRAEAAAIRGYFDRAA